MWEKTYSITTKSVSAAQMWRLFADVNNWHRWDTQIEYAQMQGEFVQGNHFFIKVKKGPKVKIRLIETEKNCRFVDLTKFPGARMTGEHRFEESKEGLKITTTMRVTGPLGFLWRRLVAQDIVATLPEETTRQIAAAAGY
jgi:hypothetical protein